MASTDLVYNVESTVERSFFSEAVTWKVAASKTAHKKYRKARRAKHYTKSRSERISAPSPAFSAVVSTASRTTLSVT